ncbi:hypothetical protein C1H46_006048 [Malus baccata]|uniref:Uncharacterized protein n=1 Tax=Malus baccata TaxID=106549 RepID=A0A540NB39_MALBA|nr:hypothetical protein C1H46_006048 [Malus baccata]
MGGDARVTYVTDSMTNVGGRLVLKLPMNDEVCFLEVAVLISKRKLKCFLLADQFFKNWRHHKRILISILYHQSVARSTKHLFDVPSYHEEVVLIRVVFHNKIDFESVQEEDIFVLDNHYC